MTSVGCRIQLIVVWCALTVLAENVEIVTPETTKPEEATKNVTVVSKDSYVRAYEEVQKLRWGPAKRHDYYDPPEKDKDGAYDTVIRSTYLADDKYPSLTHHWAPSSPPAPPPPQPHQHYHHHDHPPPPPCHQIPYSSPSTAYLGFLPKKLSLKLLLKILLKLVLFKMIVKFIAVICLLFFIPALKAKETKPEIEDDRKKARALDEVSEMIWNSIDGKTSAYGGDIGDIVEKMDDDDEENFFSGPLKAVRFLEFCVSTVDRVVGVVLGVLKRRRNEGDGLGGFVLEQLKNLVKNL